MSISTPVPNKLKKYPLLTHNEKIKSRTVVEDGN